MKTRHACEKSGRGTPQERLQTNNKNNNNSNNQEQTTKHQYQHHHNIKQWSYVSVSMVLV